MSWEDWEEITTQSFLDVPPNVEYQPIKAKFIPWGETRKSLNVKNALFMLFMLAGPPGGPSSYRPVILRSILGGLEVKSFVTTLLAE